MCGRSRQTVAPQALASAVGFNADLPLRRANQYRQRENAHPGNAAPVAYKTNSGGDALRAMRWGLVPSFTKKGVRPNFFRMFNARSETAAEKPSFRRLVGRRHGVVAFTGFYEWKQDDRGERQPYYFHFDDDRPMLFAVLYDTWQQGDCSGSNNSTKMVARGEGEEEEEEEEQEQEQDPVLQREVEEEDKSKSVLFSYAVLTTSAAPRLEWLHDRMPVILRGAADATSWLQCAGAEASAFLKRHAPYNAEDLVWHPVSKQMNTMRYDGEDCSAAIKLKPTTPLPAITSFFQKQTPPKAAAFSYYPGAGGDSSGGASWKTVTHSEAAAATAAAAEEEVTAKPSKIPSSSSKSSGVHLWRTAGADGGKMGGGAAAAGVSSLNAEVAPNKDAEEEKDEKKNERLAGSPSPRKYDRSTKGGGGSSGKGRRPPAAFVRDKKQPRMTSFFQPASSS